MKDTGLKIEALEALQYFYSFKHEPLMRCVITLGGHIDDAALGRAADLSAKAVPLIKCVFDASGRRPRWRRKDFTSDDIVAVVEDTKEKLQPEELAVSLIDIALGPLLKILVLRGPGFDSLVVIMSHLVCDGAGFKEYLYLLARLYTALVSSGGYTENFKTIDRSLAPLIRSFSWKERLDILRSKLRTDDQMNVVIPFEGDKTNPFILTRRIGGDVLAAAKSYTKQEDATLNDMFLAAYVRIFGRETGAKQVILPCPVDLRKFIGPAEQPGICNLTGNLICDVTFEPGEPFLDTLKNVSHEMHLQKADRSCVKGIMLVGLCFRLLPFTRFQELFSKSFTIPVVSYTNLGVIDDKRLSFGNASVTGAYITGAIKYVPYFQISVSSFRGACTLSCNMYGTAEDREKIESLLEEFEREMTQGIKAGTQDGA